MRAYKVRLEPNNKQCGFFNRCAGATRYVYNWGLAEWKRQYEATKEDDTLKNPSRYGLCTQFNAQKDEICPWIRELPHAVTESAFEALERAYKNFFRRVKISKENAGYPRFKNRSSRKSFRVKYTRIERDRVRITKIGWVRLSQNDYIPTSDSGASFGTYAAISERAGHWYISVLENSPEDDAEQGGGDVLGVDFGIKELAVCSDGTVWKNPHPLRNGLAKIDRLNKERNRRKPGSANRKKTIRKMARAHAKVADIRAHALHQISTDIVNKRPGAVVIEDLNVSGMLKNHCLAQAVSDVGFGELRRQIEYKCKRAGIRVIVADRFYPSSKTCSHCGAVREKLDLSERTFVCPDCGYEINRDLNAARNLAQYGRTVLKGETHPDCLGS